MMLYLLTEVSGGEDGTLVADGRFWRLMHHDLALGEIPEFTCISYTWGLGREPSPFHDHFLVSDRTVSVVKAVTRLRPACRHIWVDAFCVPLESPGRESTLGSMGYIYSIAQEVIAVLSQPVLPALTQMSSKQSLTESSLSLLENDEWVTRAWTYQETVNARALFITCDGADELIVDGQDLVNYVGQALYKLTAPPLERRAQRPGLDALEDLVDYLTAGAGERSAMQVMAKMDRRTQQRPEDHFYAMIGAISCKSASSVVSNEASEAFMQICESKGDYSFIFSAAARDTSAGRRWRPARGNIPALLQWDSCGAGQPGQMTADGLRLERVVKLGTGHLTTQARAYICTWLEHIKFLPDDADEPGRLVLVVLAALRLMGFTGSGECFTTIAGLFFPYDSVLRSERDFVVISTSVEWRFGSPGMLCYKAGADKFYSAGVFVGFLDDVAITTESLGS